MTIKQLYAMPRDDFIDYMLKSGKYRMDLKTLNVYGPAGKALKPFPDTRGHLSVEFCMGKRGCGRCVAIHRIVALLVFGKEVIFGKDVAHWDGNQLNNQPDNLRPMTRLAHMCYDKVKRTWPSCVRCGDSNGRICGRNTPARFKGERFGYNSQICVTCYSTLYGRIWRQQKRTNVSIKTLT